MLLHIVQDGPAVAHGLPVEVPLYQGGFGSKSPSVDHGNSLFYRLRVVGHCEFARVGTPLLTAGGPMVIADARGNYLKSNQPTVMELLAEKEGTTPPSVMQLVSSSSPTRYLEVLMIGPVC